MLVGGNFFALRRRPAQQIVNHLLSRLGRNEIPDYAYWWFPGGAWFAGGISLSEMSKLPPSERARRCRAHAMDARLKATTCSGDLQASYIKLAAQWEQLAREADSEANTALSSRKDQPLK